MKTAWANELPILRDFSRISGLSIAGRDMTGVVGLFLYVATLFGPPWFVFKIRRKWLGFALGSLWYWGAMILCIDYLRAIDPDYDSIAPAFVVYLGWLSGLLYCLLCYGVGLIFRALIRRRRGAGKSNACRIESRPAEGEASG
ncbi:MAG: hypothetical protein JW993_05920 [Sedimentisphaerales bacterium]|nr:hypothetical protein [Sedimentisphaerales bacterium]